MRSWKSRLSHIKISIYEICTKEFRGVFRSVVVYRTKIKAKTSFSWSRYIKHANFKYQYSYTNTFRSFVNSYYSYWNLDNRLTFMCSHPNNNNNHSYSRTQNSRKTNLHTWFLGFFLSSFFAFWGAENNVFNILPFRSRSYVLKIFGYLEVSNRVSNWNKC